MFRLSDYDFEYGEKDYVAFMDVFKKFLTICRELNEPIGGFFTADEMIDHAENYALDYVEMRHTGVVSENLEALISECINYLNYPVIEFSECDVDDYDDLLWDIYGDLS
jgi:hypothetical protein